MHRDVAKQTPNKTMFCMGYIRAYKGVKGVKNVNKGCKANSDWTDWLQIYYLQVDSGPRHFITSRRDVMKSLGPESTWDVVRFRQGIIRLIMIMFFTVYFNLTHTLIHYSHYLSNVPGYPFRMYDTSLQDVSGVGGFWVVLPFSSLLLLASIYYLLLCIICFY